MFNYPTRVREFDFPEPFRVFDRFPFFKENDFDLPKMMKTDVKEFDDRFELSAEVPGFAKDEVEISIENNVMIIKAEHKEQNEKKEDGKIISSERSFSSSQRSFVIPEGVKLDEIKASSEDGVLKIVMPKTEEVKKEVKKIEIS